MDQIAGFYHAAGQDNPHDAGFTNEIALHITPKHGGAQTGLKLVELGARITQAGYFDHRKITDMQPGALGKPQQINAPRCNILAHIAGHHVETGRSQGIVQLGVDEMHLTKVGLGWVDRHA